MQNVLVIGASGYIGSHLVPKLALAGHRVIASGRSLSLLNKRGWHIFDNVTLAQLDLSIDPISPLLNNIDTVVFLVHGMNHGHDFIDYETSICERLTDALKRSDVKHVVYLGALQPQGEDLSSGHLYARARTGEILRDSAIPVTELRAGIVIGPGSAAFEVMRDFIYHMPLLFTPKWVNSISSPIALDNLLHYLLQLVEHPQSTSEIYDVSGPETLTYRQQMEYLGAEMKKPVRIIPLTFLSPALTAHFFGAITSVPSNIARALVAGLRYDLPANACAIQARFPQHLIDYQHAVRTTLPQEQNVVRNEIWGYDPDALERWQPGFGYYAKHAGACFSTSASSAALWQVINQLGGTRGYFYANYLWTLREWIDHLFGGSARQRQRSAETQLAVGDHIDSWKVISAEPQHHLSLLFGMKAPGLGRLEFTIEDKGEVRLLDIRAWWHPAGFSGLLYWFAMMPAHLFIFKGMVKAVCRLAENMTTESSINTRT
uniref:DUF2867 domain-containing protein n=1 Tax=Thaumasiovibrio occultus TaxID=1891184 RepID=UPI00192CFAE6|nr:DUF2867 domain-containing protein [Thaumasiovibrio occultus]